MWTRASFPSLVSWSSLGDKKEDWHLPYREGAGPIGEDGMYMQAGSVNRGALRAISGVLAGAHNKPSFSIPADAMAKFKRLYKAAFGREYGEEE